MKIEKLYFDGMYPEDIPAIIEDFFNKRINHKININGVQFAGDFRYQVIALDEAILIITALKDKHGVAEILWDDFEYAIDMGEEPQLSL
jgi:hypothetical protein